MTLLIIFIFILYLFSDGATLAALPFTPAYDFDNFATTFEDPFAYSARAFEPTPHIDALNEDSSPQELDNKLLGFSDPIMNATPIDANGSLGDVSMSAELYGMFFVAEDVFGGENTGRPLELTCYRRNLWQCSGLLTLPKHLSHVMDEQGRHFPVQEWLASITALESIEGKATEIISIPWKSSNPQMGGEETKVAGAPPHIPLDLGTAQEVDAVRVSLPVSWKRLQFKHATANNGRRKGLQQHYVVQINLIAKSSSNDSIKVAEIQSGPVIVRGRSPRNFDSRKDVPLTGEKRTEKKTAAGAENATLKLERETPPSTVQKFQPMGNAPTEWSENYQPPVPHPNSSSCHPAKRVAVSPTVTRPPVPTWSGDGKSMVVSPNHRSSASRHSTAVPISLSLSEDEKSPNRLSAELQSPQFGKSHSISGQNAGSSPADDPDPLYEYFPLTVDDW
ncbi:hypothetical protein UVI_02009570 [Ustilaginoidea virens]|uniref:NDT80 domain-containing protein n=1 Tax=Ustilaginoidea virens TaxID=1159556 RepID=A0A1B5KX64_USTVR|nr:hypothetical protein UVI_02009570 [Ustilaginoidea virens]